MTTEQRTQPLALDDLVVLDLTDEKGQYMGKLMGDLGATVIKVEPPGGDPARRIGPFAGDVEAPERSLYWWHYNTSKLGVTLDIAKPEGQALLKRLVAKADVVLESFQPGYLDGLGLGYAALSAINPRLIMTSLTAYGQTGPYKDYLTSDLIALAMGGPMASTGYSEEDVPGAPPIRGTGNQGYHTGNHWGLVGTLVALAHRDATGEGQHVDASLHEALACTTEAAMSHYFYLKRAPMRQTGRHHAQTATPRTQWPTRDGRYVCAFNVPRNVACWNSLTEWMAEHGIGEELRRDPKYRQAFLSGARATPEIDTVWRGMGELISNLTAEEAYQGAQRRGYPWGAIRSPDENVRDPHFQERGFFVEVEHPELRRRYIYPNAPAVMHGARYGIRHRAPLTGEHNEQVYSKLLGLTAQEVTRLRQERTI